MGLLSKRFEDHQQAEDLAAADGNRLDHIDLSLWRPAWRQLGDWLHLADSPDDIACLYADLALPPLNLPFRFGSAAPMRVAGA